MTAITHIPEKFLQEIWKPGNFHHPVKLENDEIIEIQDCGVHNKDIGGPDFLNARIKIGNFLFTGDVEIDRYSSDWRHHGHHLSKRYNRVILHVTLEETRGNRSVFTQDGRKVHEVSINQLLSHSFRDAIREVLQNSPRSRFGDMICGELIGHQSSEEVLSYMRELGTQRFIRKSDRILLRFKELCYIVENQVQEPMISYHAPKEELEKPVTKNQATMKEVWEQLFYELVFEALGYTHNKLVMYRLAQAVPYKFVKQFSERSDYINLLEAIYFNVSGLIAKDSIPKLEESSDYMRKMTELWLEVKEMYDGKFFNREDWNFQKLRPQNFPAIRIAGAARLVNAMANDQLIGRLIQKVKELQHHPTLINSLKISMIVKAHGYWKSHFTFDTDTKATIKFFVGSSRAEEIIVNVLFPYLYTYFSVFNQSGLCRKMLRVYAELECDPGNKIVIEMAESLGIKEYAGNALINQGILQLFREMCTEQKCEVCRLGRKVFEMDES